MSKSQGLARVCFGKRQASVTSVLLLTRQVWRKDFAYISVTADYKFAAPMDKPTTMTA